MAASFNLHAEMKHQKDNLFSIDVPDGWAFIDEPGKTKVVSPSRQTGVVLHFAEKIGGLPDIEEEQDESLKAIALENYEKTKEFTLNQSIDMFLKYAADQMKAETSDPQNITLSGVAAKKIEYKTTVLPGPGFGGYVVTFRPNSGLFLSFSYGTPDKSEFDEMNNIINTFKWTIVN